MTITVDRACTNFPEQARTRTYAVTVPSLTDAPPGSALANDYFVMSPTGAAFVPGWDQFGGGVSGNYVGFWFETLVEKLAPGTFLLIGMSAGGLVDSDRPSTITTRGDGRITYCTVNAASGVVDDCFRSSTAAVTNCDSSQHSLVLTPTMVNGSSRR
jgi:hypothetical protein